MRQAAEWMHPADDRILECLRDNGNLTPQAVENAGGPAASTAQNRLPELRKYGLVELVFDTTGLYQLTDQGREYLEERLDASTLEPAEPD